MWHLANPAIHAHAAAQQNSCGRECDASRHNATWEALGETNTLELYLTRRRSNAGEQDRALNIAWHDMRTRDLWSCWPVRVMTSDICRRRNVSLNTSHCSTLFRVQRYSLMWRYFEKFIFCPLNVNEGKCYFSDPIWFSLYGQKQLKHSAK